MAVAHRPVLDGALPFAVALALAVAFLPDAVPWLAALVQVLGAAMALTTGAERPGEPALAWRLYGTGAAVLAVTVIVGGALVVVPLVMFLAGFVAHVFFKAPFGVQRLGVLSAFGRRAHDARVGRTLELAAAALALALVLDVAALYVVAGWLLTSAAVAERPTSEPAGRPLAAEPAPAA